MKKLMMMVAATLLLSIPTVQAQRVNKDALLSKLAKSNSEVADAKKNEKAATWINRGKIYFEVAAEPTKSLFAGMEAAMLRLAVGEPVGMEQTEINGKMLNVLAYPYFKVYVDPQEKVVAWVQTDHVAPNLIETAVEAYNKAVELDPKSGVKIQGGLKQISDFCLQVGNSNLDLMNYKASADAFATAYRVQSVPGFGQPDAQLLYYAGQLETLNGVNDPASFVLGADYLNRAIAAGYEGEDGTSYYYLFHCYYGQKDADAENLQRAKQALLTGIEKFPKSERLLDGLMMLYTAEEGMGNPADLVTMIEQAIVRDPENVDMWFGRGRIFAALKNNDECIVSFRKVTELAPEMYDGFFWAGYFHVTKADALLEELNNKPWTGETAYNEELKAINHVYMEAIPWLEKALEIKPNDRSSVEYLKSLSFRLRDEEGVKAKYEKYEAMLQALQAQK